MEADKDTGWNNDSLLPRVPGPCRSHGAPVPQMHLERRYRKTFSCNYYHLFGRGIQGEILRSNVFNKSATSTSDTKHVDMFHRCRTSMLFLSAIEEKRSRLLTRAGAQQCSQGTSAPNYHNHN